MKKWMALVLALAMMICAAGAMAENPFTVTGTEGTDYSWNDSDSILTIETSGQTIKMASGVDETYARIEIADDVTSVTLESVKIGTSSGAAVEQLGAEKLTVTLVGANTLETDDWDCAALQQGTVMITENLDGSYTASGSHLIINGSGRLTAISADGAGIGGGSYGHAHVTIESGKVTATSGSDGAGIGGGYHGIGVVMISGGKVTATGGFSGAGIGGGNEGNGHVTIKGGTVNATGSSNGAGIGGGHQGIGVVEISGDSTVVVAKGGDSAAGIGGGYLGAGNVTITGGTVNAKSDSGAGIGGGYECTGYVTISGGKVTAKSDTEGIGSGGGMVPTVTLSSAAGKVFKVTANTEKSNPNNSNRLIKTYEALTNWMNEINATYKYFHYEEIDQTAGGQNPGGEQNPGGQKPNDGEGQPDDGMMEPSGTQEQSDNQQAAANANLPKTGDPSNLMLFTALLGASMAGLKLRRKH